MCCYKTKMAKVLTAEIIGYIQYTINLPLLEWSISVKKKIMGVQIIILCQHIFAGNIIYYRRYY